MLQYTFNGWRLIIMLIAGSVYIYKSLLRMNAVYTYNIYTLTMTA